MAHGTKLFQRPGSPLIQGHSKTTRPFLGEWSRGLLGALVFGFVWQLGVRVWMDGAVALADFGPALARTFVVFGPVAAVGCAFGVVFARGFGWRRGWQSAMVWGSALGLIALAVL